VISFLCDFTLFLGNAKVSQFSYLPRLLIKFFERTQVIKNEADFLMPGLRKSTEIRKIETLKLIKKASSRLKNRKSPENYRKALADSM